MYSPLRLLKKTYDQILDILFPEICINCGKLGTPLCQICTRSLPRSEKYMLPHIFAAFDYQDPLVKKIIWRLKYHKRSHIGEYIGVLLYKTYREDISDIELFSSAKILVIPVPLSAKRQKERGYNQAQKIAQGFCALHTKNPFILKNNIVARTAHTAPQAKIKNKEKRLANIKNAFSLVSNEDIKGTTIFVIDDVTTTGGTLSEIMHLLEKAGAKNVYGFAFAH